MGLLNSANWSKIGEVGIDRFWSSFHEGEEAANHVDTRVSLIDVLGCWKEMLDDAGQHMFHLLPYRRRRNTVELFVVAHSDRYLEKVSG